MRKNSIALLLKWSDRSMEESFNTIDPTWVLCRLPGNNAWFLDEMKKRNITVYYRPDDFSSMHRSMETHLREESVSYSFDRHPQLQAGDFIQLKGEVGSNVVFKVVDVVE